MKTILKASLLGAAIGSGSVLLLEICSRAGLDKVWDDWFGLIPFLLAIPSIVVGEALGPGQAAANPYFVNGLLGAIIFGVVAALRRSSRKGGETH